jgi:hypothetical protein
MEWPSEMELQILEQQADVWIEELLAAEAVPVMDSIVQLVEADQPTFAMAAAAGTAAAGVTTGGGLMGGNIVPPSSFPPTPALAGAVGVNVPGGQARQVAGGPSASTPPPAAAAAVRLGGNFCPWSPGSAGLVGPGMSALMSAIEKGLQSLNVTGVGEPAAVLVKTDELQQQVLVMQQQLIHVRKQLMALGCSSSSGTS